MTQWKVSQTRYRYPIADDDADRIAILRDHHLLTTDEEPELTRIVNLVKNHFSVKMAAITLLDEDTQYLKSSVGLPDVCMTSRDVSICNYPTHQKEIMVIADLTADDRFIHNPFVCEDLALRFYAGAPIMVTINQKTIAMGTLCLFSRQPNHNFTQQQCDDLKQFATTCAEVIKHLLQRESAKSNDYKKSLFLSNITHEIRSSMNGILGMVEILNETQLDDEQSKYLQHIEYAGEQLISVINNMLDLSKAESGNLGLSISTINLDHLCSNVVKQFMSHAKQKDINIQYIFDPQLATEFTTDPIRLKRILQNLINNAIKFTPKHGKISVIISTNSNCRNLPKNQVNQHLTSSDDLHPNTVSYLTDTSHSANSQQDLSEPNATKQKQSLKQPTNLKQRSDFSRSEVSNDICIMVRDSGIGIKPESLSVIFDAYTHSDKPTHRLYSGSGLGLSVCRVLVESMGGHIWAESTVGKGTDLIFRLPSTPITNIKDKTDIHDTGHDETVNHVVESPLNDSISSTSNQSLKSQSALTDSSSVLGSDSDLSSQIDPSSDNNHINQKNIHQRLVGHILLVEDEKSHAQVTLKQLESWGHQISHVTNGQQALTVIADTPKQFDLILMDHHMPVMDGLTTMVYLTETFTPEELPPIIALTTDATEHGKKYLKYGMQDYLDKPYKKAHLGKIIQKWLQKK